MLEPGACRSLPLAEADAEIGHRYDRTAEIDDSLQVGRRLGNASNRHRLEHNLDPGRLDSVALEPPDSNAKYRWLVVALMAIRLIPKPS